MLTDALVSIFATRLTQDLMPYLWSARGCSDGMNISPPSRSEHRKRRTWPNHDQVDRLLDCKSDIHAMFRFASRSRHGLGDLSGLFPGSRVLFLMFLFSFLVSFLAFFWSVPLRNCCHLFYCSSVDRLGIGMILAKTSGK